MSSQRKTSRREFLKGRSAVEAISDLLPEETAATDPLAARQDSSSYVLQVGRTAMACEFQVLLNAGQHEGATEAALEALDLVDALEDQMTVYRDHSEVSQINRTACDENVPVEAGLFQLLEEAVSLHEATDGAFDITSGPLWKAWGFHRREGRFPSQNDLADAMQRIGSRWLQLDTASSTIRFRRKGVEINLGAIGKGYALDRCRAVLRERGVDNFVIHGGRSSILGCGSRADATQDGWSVALRHPMRPEQRLGEIRLRDRALGTSGSGNQFFHFEGKRYGHVIDPRTGYPAEGALSATVLAPSAAQADALSTAFFVLGVEDTLEFCAKRPELSVLLVSAGPRSGSIEIHSHAFDDGEWCPA